MKPLKAQFLVFYAAKFTNGNGVYDYTDHSVVRVKERSLDKASAAVQGWLDRGEPQQWAAPGATYKILLVCFEENITNLKKGPWIREI
jgi:hypothetical protein